MLHELNVDSLNLICKYLQVEDELMLSRVCKELQTFVNDRLKRFRRKELSFLSEFWCAQENEIHVPELLKTSNSTLEHVEISSKLIWNKKAWLQEHIWEKVTILNIPLCSNGETSHIIQDILRFVAKIFPNVEHLEIAGTTTFEANTIIPLLYPNIKKMVINGPMNSRSVAEMKYLEELSSYNNLNCLEGLRRAPKLKSLCLGNLRSDQMIGLQFLTKLQELTLAHKDFEIMKKRYILKRMWSLRKITTYGCTQTEIKLKDAAFCRPIDSLCFNENNVDLKLTVKGQYLRRIWCMHDWKILPELSKKEAIYLGSLEEFYYIQSSASKKRQQHVLSVVRRSPQLQYLDISGTKFEIDFIENLLHILRRQKRTKSLKLCIYDTKITCEELQCMELPQYLTITFEENEYEYDYPEQMGIRISLNEDPDYEWIHRNIYYVVMDRL